MLKSIIRCSMILLGLYAAGCKVPALTPIEKSQPPASFDGRSFDSVSSADIRSAAFYTSVHLNRLLDTVLANNYELRIARQRIDMAQSLVRQAQGFLKPQVNAVAAPALRRYGLYTMDGAGNISTDIEKGKRVPIDLPDFYVGLQSSWEIDLWGKLKQRKKASMARFYASMEGKQLIQTVLVSETAQAYYELLAADEIIRVLDQTIRLQEEAVELVKVQKETAVVNELAVQQFESQLLNMKSYRMEVLNQVNDMEARINMLAGRRPQPVQRDTSFHAIAEPQLMSVGLPASMIARRADIRQAEWELVASKADLEAARGSFYPALTLTAGIGLQAYKTGLLFNLPQSIAYGVVAGVAGPIINRNFIKAEFSKANSIQKEALLNYESVVNRSLLEVFQGINRIRNYQERYELKKQEAAISTASIEVSAELFRTGRATYLEVLLARQNALRTNIELVETRRNQYTAAIGVYRALGGY